MIDAFELTPSCPTVQVTVLEQPPDVIMCMDGKQGPANQLLRSCVESL